MNIYIKLVLAGAGAWLVRRFIHDAYDIGLKDGHREGHACMARLFEVIGDRGGIEVVTREHATPIPLHRDN